MMLDLLLKTLRNIIVEVVSTWLVMADDIAIHQAQHHQYTSLIWHMALATGGSSLVY